MGHYFFDIQYHDSKRDFESGYSNNDDTDSYYITVCPRSSDPFYIVTYYIKWVTTSWTHSRSQYSDHTFW